MLSSSSALVVDENYSNKVRLTRTLAELTTSCRLAARELGFEHFLVLARFPDALDIPVQIVISGLPAEWERIYDHYQWASIDPVITRAMTRTVPFCSDELDWSINPRAEALRGAARLHGLDHLLAIPLRGPNGEVGLMTFARHEPVPSAAHSRNALLSLAQLYAHRIYASLVDQVRSALQSPTVKSVRLSLRERQVLSLAALGDRVKVIASKLEITPRTVTYFLRRAAEKIGADTLREAICKAAMRGELQLAEYPYRLQQSTVFLRERPALRLRSVAREAGHVVQ